jgi:ribosomal protein S18 acetylase RimI-like enzyme
VRDLLWWEGDRLLGFLGLYGFAGSTIEIAGMVDPSARRRGIATALLAAAMPICRSGGYDRALLVTPRGSAAGRALAVGAGAVPDHSEYALVLPGAPTDGPSDPAITMRAATPADASDLSRLLAAAFGEVSPSDLLGHRQADAEPTLIVELDGRAVGTVRVHRDADTAGVYGFAVDPAWQGRGIGRDVLRRVCRQLRAAGVRRIGLEVEIDNDRALGLYTSLGFVPTTIEDYFALDLRAL